AVVPYLMMEDAASLIAFFKAVFDAVLTHKDMCGDIMRHSEADSNGSTIMFSNSRDEWKPATANLIVYVAEGVATFKKAIANGATTVMEMADQDYGRSGGFADPHGNVWWITTCPKGEQK